MADELTGSSVIVYPNGHDSTGLFDKPKESIPNVLRYIRAREESDTTGTHIATQELYPNPEPLSPEFSAANRLISISLDHIDRALAAHREDEPILADDAMQSVQSTLPELFCCRTLGDGFGIIVNALMCAFQHLQGIPMRRDQIEVVRRALLKLRAEPFLPVESAVDVVTDIEEVELKVEPAGFPILAEMLDE